MSTTERGALLQFFLHFLGSTFEAVDDDGSQQRPAVVLWPSDVGSGEAETQEDRHAQVY